jgi:hypothetical protein
MTVSTRYDIYHVLNEITPQEEPQEKVELKESPKKWRRMMRSATACSLSFCCSQPTKTILIIILHVKLLEQETHYEKLI